MVATLVCFAVGAGALLVARALRTAEGPEERDPAPLVLFAVGLVAIGAALVRAALIAV